ncbi:hypothetical protein GPALN_002080 [Globodera pallida]|nr:hypothetical protein GPALN_002080 [Globodera pallida]
MFSTATIFIVTTILSGVFVVIFGNSNEEDSEGESEGTSQTNSVDFEDSDDILPTSHVFAALTINPPLKSFAFASRSFNEQSLLRKSLSLNVPMPMNASGGKGRNNLVQESLNRSQSLNIERKERGKIYKKLDNWIGPKSQSKNAESDKKMRNIVANWHLKNLTETGGFMPSFKVRELVAKKKSSRLSDRKDKMPKVDE